MSYFYLKPVKGDMPIHLLEQILLKRIEYLQYLTREDTPFYSEYVIEGSIYDNVGHFTLCIISALLKRSDFTQFLINAEVTLFKQRICLLSAYDLRCFTRKLLQIIRKLDCNLPLLQPLQQLCRHITLRNVASHICNASHNEDCVDYKLKVYFKQCLPFIATRQVEVSEGFAEIPCGRWIQYLIILYKRGLTYRITQSNHYICENDPRMTGLSLIVQNILPLKRDISKDVLKSSDVDKISRYFPPCMLNLHQCLRKRHRLSHEQRFYYSLFLKDIGMPIEEAVTFWRSEYSQAPSGEHKCSHTWAKDEKKFIYGIRHMYGLEGGRNNYPSKNCQQIQNMDYSCHEGGCPFKSFDLANILQILHLHRLHPFLEKILEYKNKKMYSSACLIYLKENLKTYVNCDRRCINLSPVKYFKLAYQSDLNNK